MRCINPFVTGKGAYGCGQCMPCRLNKQRVWFHRLLLEGFTHERSCFVTLTYSEENLPDNRSLRPLDFTNFLKRYRGLYPPGWIRYFAVGEYGDVRSRPHYHAVLYGVSCDQGPFTWRDTVENASFRCSCDTCQKLEKAWPFGFVTAAPLTLDRAKYITGYVLKKMTRPDDVRLSGRVPEFARMSRRPGIGFNALHNVASEILKFNLTVPVQLGCNGKSLPLGRYLRGKLAKLTDQEIPVYKDAALQQVRAFAFQNSRSVKGVYSELWSEYDAFLQNKVRIANEKKQTSAQSL